MSSHTPCTRDDGQGPLVCEAVHDSGGDELSTSVLMALDSLPEFDASASEDLLYDRIDPDALDALFRSSAGTDRDVGSVCFPIDEYEVIVSANGDIEIRSRKTS